MDDSIKAIKGVDTNPKGRKPMALGRAEVAGSRSETIQSHIHRTGGHKVDGVNPANVHTSAKSQHYAHPDAAAHRARERSQPYPSGKR